MQKLFNVKAGIAASQKALLATTYFLQRRTNKISTQNESSLFYLIILTGFFILLELSYFVQCNKTYLGVFTFVSKNLHIPATIIPGVLYFIGAQLCIHALYCLSLWIIIELITDAIPILAKNKIYVIIAIWL